MEEKSISGSATLTMSATVSVSTIRLDVKLLDISHVSVNGVSAEYTVKEFAEFGDELLVTPEAPVTGDVTVCVTYTCGQGPACTWLKKTQTASKDAPFMFTQGQAVLNRSLFPSQCTPAVRQTYEARVTVPKGLTAVMSAEHRGMVEETEAQSVFAFHMPQLIPSYLVALAVGRLESRDIGPRSKVWAEPPLIAAAEHEFSEITEEYLATGERLFGPYLWGQYDILVMPPSFPFGGMENPRMTFVTPALLVGDRSLGDVIIHEIAHSWFGNLVGPCSWSDFWLNEGFTMYAQRRICAEVHGAAFTALETRTGQTLLRQEIEQLGEDSPLTQLRVPLADGVDPEDTYCEAPYEKGFCFVSYLRDRVGSDEAFNAWLRAYTTDFAFTSIMSEDMFRHFLEHFPALRDAGIADAPGLEFTKQWLDTPGHPVFVPDLSAADALCRDADAEASKWKDDGAKAEASASAAVRDWSTYPASYFLDALVDASPLPGAGDTAAAIERAYGFGGSKNAEIRLRAALLTVKNNWHDGLPTVAKFLASTGKQKYVLPIYRALAKGDETCRSTANLSFDATADSLHDQVRGFVEVLLERDE